MASGAVGCAAAGSPTLLLGASCSLPAAASAAGTADCCTLLVLAAVLVSPVLLPAALAPPRGCSVTLTVASAASALLLLLAGLPVMPAIALLNSSPWLLGVGLGGALPLGRGALLSLGRRLLLEVLQGAASLLVGAQALLATAWGSFLMFMVSVVLESTSC